MRRKSVKGKKKSSSDNVARTVGKVAVYVAVVAVAVVVFS